MVYVQRETDNLSPQECRGIDSACIHARTLGHPLNTHITFRPYPGALVEPRARAIDANRLQTYLRTFAQRRGFTYAEVHVWQANATGRNPHVHILMHCPKKHRDELRDKLEGQYPKGVIKLCDGSDIPRWHPSGYLGSTVLYMRRHKSPQAYWRDKMKGIKTPWDRSPCPIVGKRWGCSRNISPRAVSEYFAARDVGHHQAGPPTRQHVPETVRR